LKLPAGKYTVRETEMLMGALKIPSEYFQNKGFAIPTTIIGNKLTSWSFPRPVHVGVAVLVSLFVWWKGRSNKDK